MRIEFFMPMIPPKATAQEHKIEVVKTRGKDGKVRHVPRFYDPPEVEQARQKLTAFLAQHRSGHKKFKGGIRLMVKWCFPRGEHPDGAYRITKPDTDNLQKLLKDCMTRVGFWTDDCLVASEIVEKFWAEIPGIWIRIEELPS